jgi:hypothetical protein
MGSVIALGKSEKQGMATGYNNPFKKLESKDEQILICAQASNANYSLSQWCTEPGLH